MGIVFLISAVSIYYIFSGSKTVAFYYFLAGLVLLAVSGNSLSSLMTVTGMDHVVRGFVGVTLAAIIFCIGYRLKNLTVFTLSIVCWFLILIYWYMNAWDMGSVYWFGVVYIPFINPPALLWLALIILGFTLVVSAKKLAIKEEQKKTFAVFTFIIALLCHMAIGGLLTLQVKFLWDFYTLPNGPQVFYSILWGLYALILFVWGYLNKEKLFTYFADVVLVIVAIKVLFFDMTGVTSISKALIFLVTGILVLVIGFLNYKQQSAASFKAQRQNTPPQA
jgi:uncharacterized membrane protein